MEYLVPGKIVLNQEVFSYRPVMVLESIVTLMTKDVIFCLKCGRVLVNSKCPRHKDKVTKDKRERIGRYSGRSKRYKGAYEKY